MKCWGFDMNPILNELSLEGQYSDVDKIVELGLKPLLKILKLVQQFDFELQKKTDLWQRRVTLNQTLHDLIKVRHFSAGQKFKLLLHRITNDPPFWDTNPEQSANDQYFSGMIDVSGTSVAEACARKSNLLSFSDSNFSSCQIEVIKNKSEILKLNNFVDVESFLNWLYQKGEISFSQFITGKFVGSRLEFSRLLPEYGFDSLHNSEYQSFLDSFCIFVSLSWAEIHKHPGLKYREFHDRKFAGKASGKTYKFNVSAKMRCHGFREDDKFVVLAFERDHKLSDSG
jgi:hypothetical protein